MSWVAINGKTFIPQKQAEFVFLVSIWMLAPFLHSRYDMDATKAAEVKAMFEMYPVGTKIRISGDKRKVENGDFVVIEHWKIRGEVLCQRLDRRGNPTIKKDAKHCRNYGSGMLKGKTEIIG